MSRALYRKLFDDANTAIKNYADAKTFPLVYHLYDKGYTGADIAKILGISKQAVNKKYPKKEAK